jgi:hypothetical protein
MGMREEEEKRTLEDYESKDKGKKGSILYTSYRYINLNVFIIF